MRSLTVIPVAPCVLRTELLQLRQARDCQIARPALVSGPPVRKLLRHYGGETRHVIWKLNFARESGNCVVVRSCGLDRVCRLSVDHRNFTWIDVDEFFKCRREYRILKYEHYVHFTCAEYNALNIETFTFLDTGNIYKKRSSYRHHHIRRLNQLPYLITFIDWNRSSTLIRNSTFERGLTWHKFFGKSNSYLSFWKVINRLVPRLKNQL